MVIQTKCFYCNKVIITPKLNAGETAYCPYCKQELIIDDPFLTKDRNQGVKERAGESTFSPLASPVPLRVGTEMSREVGRPPQPTLRTPLERLSTSIVYRATISPAAGWARSYLHPEAGNRLMYFFVFLMLIPLILNLFATARDTQERRNYSLKNYLRADAPENASIKALSEEQQFEKMPDKKILGAHLPYGSLRHAVYVAIAGFIFTYGIWFFFPHGNCKPSQIFKIALLIASVGLLIMVTLHFTHRWVDQVTWKHEEASYPGLFALAQGITASFAAAADPQTSFAESFLFYVFGIGLVEELIKAWPVLRHFQKRPSFSWQASCFCGLACGAAFGIVESFFYCLDFHNGVATSSPYFICFFTSTMMQAVWTASAAMMIRRYRTWLTPGYSSAHQIVAYLAVFSVPIVLHGLFDTLLKREAYFPGFLIAVASVSWLFFLIEHKQWEIAKQTAQSQVAE